jgi:large subunit ribosomal protein L20
MRVRRGFKARRRRKKVLKLAKGYRGGRSKLYRTAADATGQGISRRPQ